ncbi:MAG: coproporphyrinogen dehydrogenase HemZ, partial [Bacillota bacterium]
EFRQLVRDIGQAFSSADLREFSVEAGRPDTITPVKLMTMREAGVDRISINPQSMRERTLQLIGRFHRPDQVEQVFRQAREAGFDNINMDLIAGLPGETPEDVLYTLERIGRLRPESLTVHTLAVKRGSNLKESGEFSAAPAPLVRDMMGLCAGAARSWGLVPYYLYRQKYMAGNLENVGYALPGKECLYNIQIMEERQSIVGLGAAAATKAVNPADRRVTSCYNPKDVATYINDLQGYVARKLTLMQRVFTSKEE